MVSCADAIRLVRAQIRWKPGKDVEHLEKRIDLGHLPPGTTLDVYEAIIAAIVQDPLSKVYLYSLGP